MAGYLNGDDEGEPGRRIAGRKWLPQVLPTHYRAVGTSWGGEQGDLSDFAETLGPRGATADFCRYQINFMGRGDALHITTHAHHVFRPSFDPAPCAENQ